VPPDRGGAEPGRGARGYWTGCAPTTCTTSSRWAATRHRAPSGPRTPTASATPRNWSPRRAPVTTGSPSRWPASPRYTPGRRAASRTCATSRPRWTPGPSVVITQLFFDNADYYRFVEDARRIGIQVPIVPGVLPFRSSAQARRFTAMCGARIPARLDALLDKVGDDDTAAVRLGIDYATEQCEQLLRFGRTRIPLLLAEPRRRAAGDPPRAGALTQPSDPRISQVRRRSSGPAIAVWPNTISVAPASRYSPIVVSTSSADPITASSPALATPSRSSTAR